MTRNVKVSEATTELGNEVSEILNDAAHRIHRAAALASPNVPDLSIDTHLQANVCGTDMDDYTTVVNCVSSDDLTGMDAIVMGMHLFQEMLKEINPNAINVGAEDMSEVSMRLSKNGHTPKALKRVGQQMSYLATMLKLLTARGEITKEKQPDFHNVEKMVDDFLSGILKH